MPKKSFTEAYNDDPTYGDNLTGDEIFGLDPPTGTLSKGTTLWQIYNWLKEQFDLLYNHDHPYIPQVPTATNENIAIWNDGDVIDSGISINSVKYKTIGVFIEKQLSDVGIELLRHPVAVPFLLEADLAGTKYSNGTNPAGTIVFTINHSTAGAVATISVDTSGVATLSGTQQLFAINEVLTITGPDVGDATVADIGINLRALRI